MTATIDTPATAARTFTFGQNLNPNTDPEPPIGSVVDYFDEGDITYARRADGWHARRGSVLRQWGPGQGWDNDRVYRLTVVGTEPEPATTTPAANLPEWLTPELLAVLPAGSRYSTNRTNAVFLPGREGFFRTDNLNPRLVAQTARMARTERYRDLASWNAGDYRSAPIPEATAPAPTPTFTVGQTIDPRTCEEPPVGTRLRATGPYGQPLEYERVEDGWRFAWTEGRATLRPFREWNESGRRTYTITALPTATPAVALERVNPDNRRSDQPAEGRQMIQTHADGRQTVWTREGYRWRSDGMYYPCRGTARPRVLSFSWSGGWRGIDGVLDLVPEGVDANTLLTDPARTTTPVAGATLRDVTTPKTVDASKVVETALRYVRRNLGEGEVPDVEAKLIELGLAERKVVAVDGKSIDVDKVREAAREMQREKSWCGVVDRVLEELGVPLQPEPVKIEAGVTLTNRGEVEAVSVPGTILRDCNRNRFVYRTVSNGRPFVQLNRNHDYSANGLDTFPIVVEFVPTVTPSADAECPV